MHPGLGHGTGEASPARRHRAAVDGLLPEILRGGPKVPGYPRQVNDMPRDIRGTA